MTDPFTVPTARTIWVFRVDLPEPALEAFSDDSPVGPSPLATALGAGPLDPDFTEVFDAATLCDYGLARYLIEANGMDPDSVAPDTDMLDALTGPVALVFSTALPDGTTQLAPTAPLLLVGRYSERPTFTVAPPLQSDAAKGVIGDAPVRLPAPRGRLGSIASLALIAVFLIAGMLIWAGLR